MKLEAIKSLLESAVTNDLGQLTNFGMILPGVEDSGRAEYGDVEGIEVYIDKAKFQKAVIKYFAKHTGNEDDLFLSFDDIIERDEYEDFVEVCWIFDQF